MEIKNCQHFFKECDKQQTPDHFKFYREVKFSKNLSFEGRMHIYEFVMHMLQHLGLSKTVELGACNDLFSPYFEKGGFSKTFGMFFITLRHDQSLFIKSIFKPQRLKRALVDWVVNGDFHTYIIDMIYEHPYKSYFEESLRKLECRIIRNSLIAGIKDESFWKSCYIMPKLIISEEDLNNLLISVTTSSNDDQKDSENQVCDLIPSEENMDTTSYYQQFDSEKADEECKNDNTSSLNTNSTCDNSHFIYLIINYHNSDNYHENNNYVKNNYVKNFYKNDLFQFGIKNLIASQVQKTSMDTLHTEKPEQTPPLILQPELEETYKEKNGDNTTSSDVYGDDVFVELSIDGINKNLFHAFLKFEYLLYKYLFKDKPFCAFLTDIQMSEINHRILYYEELLKDKNDKELKYIDTGNDINEESKNLFNKRRKQILADFSYHFIASFRGIGYEKIDYYKELEKKIIIEGEKRSAFEHAKIACLLYFSKYMNDNKRPQTFKKWYQYYCDVVGCEFNRHYKPSKLKLKDNDRLKNELDFLF
jgi:hypothetical protein